MPDAEAVVGAFVHARKSADAAFLAQCPEGFAAAGQNLMCIGLMANVEDYLVLGGVEYVMVSHNEFHCAEAGSQMPGIL